MSFSINYSDEYGKESRAFPKFKIFLLVLLVLFQIGCILFIALYQPAPLDRIESYNVTVTPLEDGSLAIEYDILWRALDEDEPLTWVTVGMANPNFKVYTEYLSDTIEDFWLDTDGDYVGLRLDLKDSYSGGETVRISFAVHQHDVLCKNSDGYFYEFVPGWFNRIPVSSYEFKWKRSAHSSSVGALESGAYYVWSGDLKCGEYDMMQVYYDNEVFEGCHAVAYKPFSGEGAYNALKEDGSDTKMLAVMLIFVALVSEIYIIDSYVSYKRGRGFLMRYGHRVHVYGHVNPHYRRARDQRASSGRGGGGGRGCACACACACAGGGRAGCSQKDTFGASNEKASPEQTEEIK